MTKPAFSNMSKQLQSEILITDHTPTGKVCKGYEFAINNITGELFYKDPFCNWQSVTLDTAAWALNGNTISSSNFLGSNNNIPLQFKVNAARAGYIAPTPIYTTSFGVLSVPAANTGIKNSGFGAGTLGNNTTGADNSAVGYAALNGNTTGGLNTAMGWSALGYNKTGANNTAIGAGALNTTTAAETFGSSNTAIGFGALQDLFTGSFNIGLGYLGGATQTGTSNTMFISPNTTKLFMNLDVLGTSAPNVVGLDGSGFWHVYAAPSAVVITASNGLTKTVNNIALGGTLLADTVIHAATKILTIDGTSSAPVLSLANSSSGASLLVNSNTGTGAQISSGTGIPLYVIGAGSNSTVSRIALIVKGPSGAGANGIGGSIDFEAKTTVIEQLTNQLISKLTDATDATRTSEFSITGVNSAVTNVLLQITGAGIFTLTQGLSNFADDAAAAIGLIPVNGLYRTGSAVKIRVS